MHRSREAGRFQMDNHASRPGDCGRSPIRDLLMQREVQTETRQAYAELVRHFYSGRMTNDQYEAAFDRLDESADDAIDQIYCKLWTTYCDFKTHKMGRCQGMTREARRMLARWILFLKSDRPYEYPIHGCHPLLLTILTLGLYRKPAPETFGDSDYWPYFRESDFREDQRKPVYLAGDRRTTR